MLQSILTVIAASLSLAMSIVADAKARGGKCRSSSATVLAEGPLTVVYKVEQRNALGTIDSPLMGCDRSTGRKRVLADDFNENWFDRPARAVALHGSLIGFAVQAIPDGIVPVDFTIIRFEGVRASSRRLEREIQLPGKPKVGSLDVTNAGAVAWVECPSTGGFETDPRPNCVRAGNDINRVIAIAPGTAEDVTTGFMKLGKGRTIDPRSVRISRSAERVSWVQMGRRRSAPLS